MNLPGVVFLAGRTVRAQAYAQAMARAGMKPEWAFVYGAESSVTVPPSLPQAGPPTGLPLPDLSVPLEETAANAGWRIHETVAGNVNDPAILDFLKRVRPALVIYAGYGGQIVGDEALSVAPFMHVHSGNLPEERGSTTVYYGILKGTGVWASAILLERKIDTGPVLLKAEYPLPPAGLDIDRLYDPAIRADLLLKALREYAARGHLPEGVRQEPDCGEDYYVIHPVLKHIAALSINKPQL
ncbi:MAG: methionyl-tRNA formyltransferase [Nitrospinae bacterium]|nr:methionyl-tRNA formyltransferase [Nitrospinota bacterium]